MKPLLTACMLLIAAVASAHASTIQPEMWVRIGCEKECVSSPWTFAVGDKGGVLLVTDAGASGEVYQVNNVLSYYEQVRSAFASAELKEFVTEKMGGDVWDKLNSSEGSSPAFLREVTASLGAEGWERILSVSKEQDWLKLSIEKFQDGVDEDLIFLGNTSAPKLDNNCGADGEKCFTSGFMSTAEIGLSAGNYSLRINTVDEKEVLGPVSDAFIQVRDFGNGGGGPDVATPEPSTMVLLAGGILMFCIDRRRRA